MLNIERTCLHIFWGWRSHTSSGLSTVTSWVVLRHWGCPDTKAQLSGAQAWRQGKTLDHIILSEQCSHLEGNLLTDGVGKGPDDGLPHGVTHLAALPPTQLLVPPLSWSVATQRLLTLLAALLDWLHHRGLLVPGHAGCLVLGLTHFPRRLKQRSNLKPLFRILCYFPV